MMKINGMTVFGIAALGLGTFGVYNATMSFAKPEFENRNVTTTGIITRVHGTEIRHRLTNIKLNSEFKFSYKFTAEDGKEYSNTDSVNETAFGLLREGQEITVRYHSNNPTINASSFGHYVSVAQIPKSTRTFRLLFSLGFCCIGGLSLVAAYLDHREREVVNPETRHHALGSIPPLSSTHYEPLTR